MGAENIVRDPVGLGNTIALVTCILGHITKEQDRHGTQNTASWTLDEEVRCPTRKMLRNWPNFSH